MTATAEQAMDAELARIFETWSDKDRGEVRRALHAALHAAGWAVVPVVDLQMIADIAEGSTTPNSLSHIAKRARTMLAAAECP